MSQGVEFFWELGTFWPVLILFCIYRWRYLRAREEAGESKPGMFDSTFTWAGIFTVGFQSDRVLDLMIENPAVSKESLFQFYLDSIMINIPAATYVLAMFGLTMMFLVSLYELWRFVRKHIFKKEA